MKKLLAAGALGLLMAGGTVYGAVAAPGPNGSNNHGLCTAYFNGSENGQANKRKAGPFAALELEASDDDESTSPAQDVWTWCSDLENNPGGIGGNPDDPNVDGDTSGRSKPKP